MGLTVGTSINDVKAKIKYVKLEPNVKNALINFCSKDIDGKITDDVELYIINNYLSGKETIEMSKLGEKCATKSDFKTLLKTAYKSLVGEPFTTTYVLRDACISHTNQKSFGGLTHKGTNITFVQDTNLDGKADLYVSTYWDSNKSEKIRINLTNDK